MKTLNFFKKALLAIFTLTMAFNFAACSDDNGDEFDPINPAVKKLPKVIIEKSFNGTSTDIEKCIFDYNSDNQVVRVVNHYEYKDSEDPQYNSSYSDVYTISYSESGEITKIVKNNEESSQSTTYTFAYNATEGTVQITTNGYTEYARTIKIDKNGYLASSKELDENDYTLYEYDKYNNLTKEMSYYKHSDKTGTEEDTYTSNLAYSTTYSPLINSNLPAWILSNHFIELGFDYFVGNHTPKYMTSEEITTITTEGEEPKTDKESGSSEISIKESVDNYPTFITSKSEWTEKDDEGKDVTFPSTASMNIEYITIE